MFIAKGLAATSETIAARQPGKLHSLSEVPKEPRFILPEDRVWPVKAGDADVCLWADDKLAAASITIDDNWAPDHAWWLEIGQKTGFRFTWFVITERVGTGSHWGTWREFQKLYEGGHDIQSHSVTHLRDLNLPIEAEYHDSQAAIQKALAGDKVICLAYPGGLHTEKNDPAVAARYYIAARGTVGAANQANNINYMQTNSATINKEWVDKILDKEQHKRGKYGCYRGWLCSHYHGIHGGKTEEERNINALKVADNLQYLKSKETDIWVGLFREVVLYGQERDTAKIKVVVNSNEQIKFNLTCDMDEAIFDYPLTIKLRLPNDWGAVMATQGDKVIEAKLVMHEDGKFALVKAVPNREGVVLTPVPVP